MALSRDQRSTLAGVAFLLPNIVGVLTFTVFPVLFAILLAFTNWDLSRHNMFKDEPLKFVGLENFLRLFLEDNFLRYLGNTLFLMIGIPFGIGASLFSAMMLSKDPRGGGGRVFAALLATALLVASVGLLAAVGAGGSGMVLLLSGIALAVLVTGVAGGNTVYRTLFYTPHFTAGVATFLLWKKLYDPYNGPINSFLAPPLDGLASVVNATPPALYGSLQWAGVALAALLLWWGVGKLRRMWSDGDVGTGSLVMPMVFLATPTAALWLMAGSARWLWALTAAALLTALAQGALAARGREFGSKPMEGAGSALVLALAVLVGQFVLVGLALVAGGLPAMAADGLEPPLWINDADWAKPAIMLMGFWGAIGSNNMLLYLAALTNVPPELYEASDIDGASRFQKFWHVTCHQLAPTTNYIAFMSIIGGLQGGFEMARTMTRGGPDGATTTLAYFIYIEGFETGRLSFSAGIAWALFLLVFLVTMFNWKFGNKYVND